MRRGLIATIEVAELPQSTREPWRKITAKPVMPQSLPVAAAFGRDKRQQAVADESVESRARNCAATNLLANPRPEPRELADASRVPRSTLERERDLGQRLADLAHARRPVGVRLGPRRVLPQPPAGLVGGANALQAPASRLRRKNRIRVYRLFHPFCQLPFARNSEHRRAVEPVAEDFERSVVTRVFPPQPLNPQ